MGIPVHQPPTSPLSIIGNTDSTKISSSPELCTSRSGYMAPGARSTTCALQRIHVFSFHDDLGRSRTLAMQTRFRRQVRSGCAPHWYRMALVLIIACVGGRAQRVCGRERSRVHLPSGVVGLPEHRRGPAAGEEADHLLGVGPVVRHGSAWSPRTARARWGQPSRHRHH